MTYRLLILFITIVCCSSLRAQKLPAGPQVLTFFSDLDDTEQPYGLYLPRNYDPARKYPLVMMLHGAGSNHRLALRRVFGKSNVNGETDVEASRYFPEWNDVEYIVATPFARGTMGYQGVAEKDVYDVLADVKKRFNIDEDRTYLTGLSMGGGGTLWIGLTRPDIWAALAPVCPAPPAGTENFVPNAFNLPMHFYHGDADQAVPVTVSRDWTKRLKEMGAHVEYDEYPGVEHNSWENAYKDGSIFKWFDKFKRNLFPDHVKFTTTQHRYNKAYWLTIDDFTHGTPADLDVKFVNNNLVEATAFNVHAFTVTLHGHPKYDQGEEIRFTINGRKVKVNVADTLSFQLKNGKWVAGKLQRPETSKRAGLEGPVADAFLQRHIYVYGTQGNPTPEEQMTRMDIAVQAANFSLYRNAFLGRIMFFPRVVADKDVRPSDLESSNLFLFGTRETNSLIQKYAHQLPMHLNADAKDVSLLYVYPVSGHYLVINSGLPWWQNYDSNGQVPPLPFQLAARAKDILIFKSNPKNIILEGYFNEDWKLTNEQKNLLKSSGIELKPEM